MCVEEQERTWLKKKERKKKGGGRVRVDEKKLDECQHHWFNLGRTKGKGRDPIKITLGWSEWRLTWATTRGSEQTRESIEAAQSSLSKMSYTVMMMHKN